MLTAIVGINWGDEGKGRMVDLLSREQDVIVRYQGGNNAGHTVCNERGKFVLNLLPSGILRPDKVNVMGCGMVIDAEHLFKETGRLRAAGVSITPDNLVISDRAVICFPYNVMQDCLEEDRLADKKFGSTRRGIAPIYADKYMKKAIRMGDLTDPAYLDERIETVLDWKNLCLSAYEGAKKFTPAEIKKWLEDYAMPFVPYIKDAGAMLYAAAAEGKRIMLEAQLGALRDIDYGIYPYTSSSNTIAAYAPVGAGVPGLKVDRTIGVMKAYSTCVGEGPFTAEMFGEEAERLREAGGEYGAATARHTRLYGRDPRGGRLRDRRRAHGGLPLRRKACEGASAYRQAAGLETVHRKLPYLWRSAGGCPRLCALYREERGHRNRICVRGRRARQHNHHVTKRRVERAKAAVYPRFLSFYLAPRA